MPNKETAKTASARNNSLAVPIFIIGIFIFLFAVIGLWLNVTLRETGKVITVGNQTITVEVADTVGEREKGLSERDNMPSNKGMLFDFKQNGKWQMWMLKMRFNLDMAWLDETGKIVYIRESLTPDTFPNVFIPDTEARYVLEVNSGTLRAAGVKVGDIVKL